MLLSQVLDQILMIQPQKSALGTLLLAMPHNKSLCYFIPEVMAIGLSAECPEWSTPMIMVDDRVEIRAFLWSCKFPFYLV